MFPMSRSHNVNSFYRTHYYVTVQGLTDK